MNPAARAAERYLAAGTAGAPRLLESRSWRPPVSGSPGARPRTLPAAVSPVLAGTGVAAYADHAVWWKALLALVVSLALQVGVNYANDYSDGIRGTDDARVGPMRLVASRRGHAARRSRRAAFLAFGVAGVAGLVLAATTAWWLLVVGAGQRRRGLVLHRRLDALRLPRPGRGHGVRLLRPGRRDRHDLRADRDAGSGRRCTPRSASARWPARSSWSTTCATSRPTAEVGKRTLAVVLGADRTRALYAAAGARRRGVAVVAVARGHHLVGAARAWASWCRRRAGVRTVPAARSGRR